MRAEPHPSGSFTCGATALGSDSLTVAALDRCPSLGSVAGDLALPHGAGSVVIAAGSACGLSIICLHRGGRQRFSAKGHFAALMNSRPVKFITYPQPSLLGAAARTEEYGA